MILGKVVLSVISIAEKQRIITYFGKGTISCFRVNVESETKSKLASKDLKSETIKMRQSQKLKVVQHPQF